MSIADFIDFLAPGIVTLKHLTGQHDQARHAWRYGSVDAARRSMQGMENMGERDEYRRRAGLADLRGGGGRPEVRSYPLSESVVKSYRANVQDELEWRWQEAGLRGDPLSFAQRAYNVVDSGTGLRAQVSDIYLTPRGVEIEGDIYKPNGEYAGHFDRTFDFRNNSVHHDLMRMTAENQRGGFGSRFYQNAEKQYIRAGIKKVRMTANLDAGGYAWARMGFDFSDRKDGRADALDAVRRAWYQRYRYEMPYRVESRMKHAWEFAMLRGPDGFAIGHEGMAGTSWEAYKILNRWTLGYKIGKEYYASKR